ncbi:MAG: hypothetical protein J5822_08365 [Eubacteriaceae bacterium]|nr:hypothetical protein [Eubacteriaceae bacterium]
MKSFREWFRDWDSGRYDLTEMTASSGEAFREDPDSGSSRWARTEVFSIRADVTGTFRKLYPVMSLILCAVIIVFLLYTVEALPPFASADTPANAGEVSLRYNSMALEETGALNVVSGVILDYRAFDTLGESHVLFAAAVAVFILMLEPTKGAGPETLGVSPDTVLEGTARVLGPVIAVFGIYIILNGHLGPGGGFAGGSVLSGAMILIRMTSRGRDGKGLLSMKGYRIITASSLIFYSLAKGYSFWCGANGHETIFSAGEAGRIFSAGLILPLNIAVGAVVACTMYGFYSIFTGGEV